MTTPLPSLSPAPADPLLAWFQACQRPLPWRATRDPYAIWISEIMLQQTQVVTVIPYYERFLARFPSIGSLAAAPLDEVLKAWEGLGYYRRARMLHAAAGVVVERHGGVFPAAPEAIRALPGIGPYTAGAIASLAFDRPEPAVDGNVFRVLARVFACADDVTAAATRGSFEAIARALIPAGEASRFNQALMELGALVCTPQAPACTRCPWEPTCLARAAGRPEAYPVKLKKVKVQPLHLGVAMLEDPDGRLLVARRPASGLLAGLWEFPSFELPGPDGVEPALRAAFRERFGWEPGPMRPLVTLPHRFTHRQAHYHAWAGSAPSCAETEDGRWVVPGGWDVLALPHVMRALAARWVSPAAGRTRP